jgi:hypothetical protein
MSQGHHGTKSVTEMSGRSPHGNGDFQRTHGSKRKSQRKLETI